MEIEIGIPAGVEVKIAGGRVAVKGKLGEIEKIIKMGKIKNKIEGNKVMLSIEKPRKREKALIGAIAAHIKSMMRSVEHGCEYRLKMIYVHFPISISVEGKKVLIRNFIGEKTPRTASIVGQAVVTSAGQDIFVKGINKEDVGQTAANIEQATRVRKRDQRIFQDGIFLVSKGED